LWNHIIGTISSSNLRLRCESIGGIDLSVGSILGTTAVAAMVVSLIPEFAMLSVPDD
jgi:predicted ABC-type sugar transport system permease subunit